MQLLSHPDSFRTGTRVLFLKGRNKDGVDAQRMISRVTHDSGKFGEILSELAKLSRPNERIYASADARDLRAAARHFKHAQIDAEHAADLEDFYRHLPTRWASSLMQPTSRAEKNWIFDCDTPALHASISARLAGAGVEFYAYPTKSGHHIVTRPFDRRVLREDEAATLHDNALMLWAY